MNLELSGINVLISLGCLSLLLIVLIISLKSIFRSKKINALKEISLNFKLGLMTALTFVLLSFSWTTYDTVDYGIYEVETPTSIEVEIPRTDHPKPIPPPPPLPVEIEVPDEIIDDEDDIDFVDQSVEEDEPVVDAPIAEPVKEDIPLPPPPPPVEVVVPDIFDIAEQMPRFPGCESMDGTHKEKRACADQKLLAYIYKNLKYPQLALEENIEGTTAIQFVVDTNGKISDAKIVRDIGAGCGAAVLKLVNNMNGMPEAWTPGKQRGKKVKVRYTLPIKFKVLN